MRDPEYKAWESKYEFMGYVLSIDLLNGMACVCTDAVDRAGSSDSFTYRNTALNDNPVTLTLLEYTGLKDKNGVKIYEGDVIEWREEGIRFSVRWSQEDCGYICMRDLPLSSGSMNQQYLDHFEVIGTTFENPELLD